MNRGQLFSLFFPNLLILNDRLQIFVQYHFGGLSRCTLIVCFGSVMSIQWPYVFHPSAKTCTRTLPMGAFGTCAMPSRLVFTFNSSFVSFFIARSSMNFTYTLAFSTGTFFSPPVTSIVMRVWTSLAAAGVCGLAVAAFESWATARCAIAAQTVRQRLPRIFVVSFINRRTPWSTERQAGSSLATLRLDAACTGLAAPPVSAVET